MSRLLVDARWLDGHFGMARWGREIVSRLPQRFDRLEQGPEPASPTDPLFLARAQRRHRADVFFSPWFAAGVRTSTVQLLVVHDLIHLDDPAERSRAKSLYYAAVVRPAIRRAGVVLTVSEFSRDRLVRWTGLPRDRVVVAPGAASGSFTPEAAATATAPSGAGYAELGPYVVFVGNSKPHRRVLDAIAAMQHVPDHRLVLVGHYDAATHAAAAGLPQPARFLPDVTDAQLAALYRDAACLLMPSDHEGFGLPALEAVSVETPVVYSSESVREIVASCGVALLPGAPPAAAGAAVRDALNLPETWADWGQACAEVRSRYTWDASAATVSKTLDSLL